MLSHKILKKKTNKLFYKKYPYKIECFLSGSSYIVRLGLERTLNWADSKDNRDGWIYKNANKSEIKKFAEKYATFSNEDIKVRVEGAHFNIFVTDQFLYNRICNLMEDWVVGITEPGSLQELEVLLNENKKVICNSIPDGIFNYRIYFKTSKFKNHDKIGFLNWLQRYPGKYKLSYTTEKYLLGLPSYPQNPFVYVTDRPMANTVILYLGNRASKVEEFITRSSINTILCQPLVKI